MFLVKKEYSEWSLEDASEEKIIEQFYKVSALEKRMMLLRDRKKECATALRIIEAFSRLHDPLKRIEKLSKAGSVNTTLEDDILDLKNYFNFLKDLFYDSAIQNRIDKKETETNVFKYKKENRVPSLEKLLDIVSRKELRKLGQQYEKIYNKTPSSYNLEFLDYLFQETNKIGLYNQSNSWKKNDYPPLDDDDDYYVEKKTSLDSISSHATLYGYPAWLNIDIGEVYLSEISYLENELSKENESYKKKCTETELSSIPDDLFLTKKQKQYLESREEIEKELAKNEKESAQIKKELSKVKKQLDKMENLGQNYTRIVNNENSYNQTSGYRSQYPKYYNPNGMNF